MPQPRRIPQAEGPFHVTARGNRGQAIFVEDRDRARFMDVLARVSTELGWRLHAYCLMTNHYHLVLDTPRLNLSSGMQRLNAAYAQWFNRHHELSGHLFRHRFYAGLVASDSHLLELMRYLALNPVRGGLCAAPADWPWSSYGAVLSREASRLLSSRVLSSFGPDEKRARETLRAFVEHED
jgi:putative transposase